MADSIHRSNVHLGVDATEFVKGINGTAAEWKRFQKQAENSMKAVETAKERYDRRMAEIKVIEEKLPQYRGEAAERMRAKARVEYQAEALKEQEAAAQALRVKEDYQEKIRGDRRRRARELDAKHQLYTEQIKARAVQNHIEQLDKQRDEAAKREAYMAEWLHRRKVAQAKHEQQMNAAAADAAFASYVAQGALLDAQQEAAGASGGGAGNATAVATQLGFAVDDFASQVGEMGIGGGLRAAANNISSVAMLIDGPLLAAVTGVTFALAGPLIKAWTNSTDEMVEFKDEAVRTIEVINRLNDLRNSQRNAERDLRDIRKMEADEVKNKIDQNTKDIIDARQKLIDKEKELQELQSTNMEQLIGGPERRALADQIVNILRDTNVGKGLKQAQKDIYEAIRLGDEAAISDSINRWNDFVSSNENSPILAAAYQRLSGINMADNPFKVANVENDVVLRIAEQAREAYLASAEAAQELANSQAEKVALLEREAEVQKEILETIRQSAIESNVSMREQLNSLMASTKEEAIVMNMTNAQKFLHDYQKRRNELMAEAAILGDEELTRADQLLMQLLQAEEKRVQMEIDAAKTTQQQVFSSDVITQTGSGLGAASQAMASAMQQYMDKANKPEDRNFRMLRDELRAIREAMRNPNAVRVGQ